MTFHNFLVLWAWKFGLSLRPLTFTVVHLLFFGPSGFSVAHILSAVLLPGLHRCPVTCCALGLLSQSDNAPDLHQRSPKSLESAGLLLQRKFLRISQLPM